MHALAAASPGGAVIAGRVIIGVLLLILAIAAYCAPSIIAVMRHIPNAGSVIVVDLLLGWTFIGWIVALAMACRSQPPQYAAPPSYPARQWPHP